MTPNFSAVSALQEKQLIDKLEMARQLISHPAEKGRSLEVEVAAVLRELLPAQYGVGTGFIASHGPDGSQLSAQLDVIIYDAIRGGPITRLAGCEVYPIESVYAYVEVKAVLSFAEWSEEKSRDNSLQRCLRQNTALRKLKTRFFLEPTPPIGSQVVGSDAWMSLRAFVFAFEIAEKYSPVELAQLMSDLSKRFGAHLHGVAVLNRILLFTQAVDARVAKPEDYYHVAFTTANVLTALRLQLLQALGSFSRPHDSWIPAWNLYFDDIKDWEKVSPRT